MASDYGNPKPSLFVSEHLSPQSKEDASELLRTEQRFIAGGRAASFRQGRKIYPEEFEKTPKKSIKRFLYQEVK